ncbi:MAG: cell filamentation protein Fic [Comamonadaceae bacterium CG1_02_60_18]|nr:MAG: cell filamentation protein Fic [Comamonadaceae bacterium CG1_02_60_18]PIQ51743.1 MAG: cell filamentation protein Fic [Comamonadaceae bacterium CG12_big_fil_rev_8_21_14_0_65_59_15]
MPRVTPTEELKLIESIVADHPNGLGISAIEAEIARRQGVKPNRRTLQRRLQKLIQAQHLSTDGESIALVYKVADGHLSTALSRGHLDTYVPLSAEGSAIRNQIRQALMHRRPVGYQREFLDAYQPGVTFYLPESLRQQLHDMGQTPALERPAGTYAREILGRLLVDLSWASSRLEGNTYSRLDTQNLIEFGQAAQGKDAIETQMILNHKAAIEMLVEDAQEVGLDAFTFKNLHAVLSQELMRDPQASGRLRRRPVEVAGTVFHPLAMPQVIEDCFLLLLAKATAIADPFEQAFFLMVQLPYLQPFEDVNKRVSRIGANIPLIKHNLCPLSFVDVPERAYIEGTLGVYELNQIDLLRDVFVWAYERSCQRYLAITQTMVAPDPLKIKYRVALIQAVQAVIKTLRQPSPAVLAALAQQHAPKADQSAFTQMLSQALHQLHEGSLARYRLRRSEYLAWQQAQTISKVESPLAHSL